MDQNLIITLVAAALLAFFIYRNFAGKVAPERARQLVSAGAKLVDVRSPAEYTRGHIDGAINVPVQELDRWATEQSERTEAVVVYCASGARSGRAKRLLQARGFTEVVDLGAMARWG